MARILAGLDIKPHRVRFRLSRPDDPEFWERAADVCGLWVRAYLNDLHDGEEGLLDVAAVVRRVSMPLLEAMLPNRPPGKGFETLRQLPFVDITSDGLALHSALQESIATRLRAAARPDIASYANVRGHTCGNNFGSHPPGNCGGTPPT